MKHPHRFCEPYPENPRCSRFKPKQNGRTKIELDLKDAVKLADILQNQIPKVIDTKSPRDYQLINLLIKKLRNAEPELEF